jgi:hypothetical protein
MKTKNMILGVILLIVLIGGGFWLFKGESKELPGKEISDMGRDHVPDGTEVGYNSEPPTSGSHYKEWIKAGVYDNPIRDGHLVHSLEHGYIIISYNCLKLNSNPKS